MRMKRLYWPKTPRWQIVARLRKVCGMESNRHLTGDQIRRRYFRGITRGGLIVTCWREGIKLPRTRRWPRRERHRIGRHRSGR